MLKYIILLSVIATGSAHYYHHNTWCQDHPWHCGYHHNHFDRPQCPDMAQLFFDRIARDLIEVDRQVEQFCKNNNRNGTTEHYGLNFYTLTIPLEACKEDSITVTMRHRVLFIKAVIVKKNKDEVEEETYTEIRVLAQTLNAHHATWTFKNGKIQVFVPYKVFPKFDEEATCDAEIGFLTRTLPIGEPNLPIVDKRIKPDEEQTSKESNNDKDRIVFL